MDPIGVIFGKNLKKFLKTPHTPSQVNIAKAVGISPGYLGDMLAGRTSGTETLRRAICRYLDQVYDEMIGLEIEPRPFVKFAGSKVFDNFFSDCIFVGKNYPKNHPEKWDQAISDGLIFVPLVSCADIMYSRDNILDQVIGYTICPDLPPGDYIAVQVENETMSPDLPYLSIAIIDLGDRSNLNPEHVYCGIWGGLPLRRVVQAKGRIVVFSDNPDGTKESEPVVFSPSDGGDEDNNYILGRVVYVCGKK